MEPMPAASISGTWATVLTPFTATDDLDLAALDTELDLLLASGADGVYTHGTAGEFHNQTHDEWLRVVGRVSARCEAAGMPYQLGASHPCVADSLVRIRAAAALRPAAIQVTLPTWSRLTAAERDDCLRLYAEAAGAVGLVLYNPPHHPNLLDPDSIDDVCRRQPSIVGVKLADGDDAWYTAMGPVLERLSVFVPGHHLATGLAHGARGAYSNVACLSPRGAVQWSRGALEDPSWAAEVEQRIGAFMDEAIAPLVAAGYTSTTLDKTMAAAGGHLGDPAVIGHVRRPYATAPPEQVARVRAAAGELLPDFLRPA